MSYNTVRNQLLNYRSPAQVIGSAEHGDTPTPTTTRSPLGQSGGTVTVAAEEEPFHVDDEDVWRIEQLTLTLQEKEEKLGLAAELGLKLLDQVKDLEHEKEDLVAANQALQHARVGQSHQADRDYQSLEEEFTKMREDLEASHTRIQHLERSLHRETAKTAEMQDKLETALLEVIRVKEYGDRAAMERNKLATELSYLQTQLEIAHHQGSPPSDAGTEPDRLSDAATEADSEVWMLLARDLQVANMQLRNDLEVAEQQITILSGNLSEANRLLQDSQTDQETLRTRMEDHSGTDSPAFPQPSVLLELEEVVRRAHMATLSNLDPADNTSTPDNTVSRDGPGPATTPLSIFYSQLQQVSRIGTGLHKRLKESDVHCVNRKIRRSFDLSDLSKISHTLIENVRMDAKGFPARFSTNTLMRDFYNLFLVPLVTLVQDLLLDNCDLRLTLNEYIVKLFEKMSETPEPPPSPPQPPSPPRPPPNAIPTLNRSSSMPVTAMLPSAKTIATWFMRKPASSSSTVHVPGTWTNLRSESDT
ncbi:hypothetical protein DFS34DRAFT_125199 [Phlyctochytrium arcticum]|nr:hypothetical protein DFS34DRAFT_125199 [Phlyctochytrium arcticum]